ncbi:MAG TPA: cytochrome c family protein [Methylovirgula sp.]|nr:cytochrome c family protein [Methylovirgula sp.]
MSKKSVVLLAAGLFGLMAVPAFAAGDPAAGEQIFNHTCKLCHRIGPGASNFVGPNLNGIDGRTIASEPGYDYSQADQDKKKAGFVWNEQNFDKYIANPQQAIPGTKMLFPGLPKDSDRANIWAYISQFKADGSKK